MIVYALICEAACDDDRLLGVYSTVDAARAAYGIWEYRGYYPFIRIEARELNGMASERHPIDETGVGE